MFLCSTKIYLVIFIILYKIIRISQWRKWNFGWMYMVWIVFSSCVTSSMQIIFFIALQSDYFLYKLLLSDQTSCLCHFCMIVFSCSGRLNVINVCWYNWNLAKWHVTVLLWLVLKWNGCPQGYMRKKAFGYFPSIFGIYRNIYV